MFLLTCFKIRNIYINLHVSLRLFNYIMLRLDMSMCSSCLLNDSNKSCVHHLFLLIFMDLTKNNFTAVVRSVGSIDK